MDFLAAPAKAAGTPIQEITFLYRLTEGQPDMSLVRKPNKALCLVCAHPSTVVHKCKSRNLAAAIKIIEAMIKQEWQDATHN